MRESAVGWPEPSSVARAVSRQLAARITARIEAAGGFIPFSEYMQAALYEPGLGYYSGGSTKLGPDGDFVTAPAFGDFFARALVATALPVLAASARPQILELGAGTGVLALQILTALERASVALSDYFILETSPELKQRQQATLTAQAGRVRWIDSLEGLRVEGVVLANEVADALPCERFRKTPSGIQLLGVGLAPDGFEWRLEPDRSTNVERALALAPGVVAAWSEGYESEFRPLLKPWITTLAESLQRGALLVVDYGLTRSDYYRAERNTGTLMCHYRHRAHADPFLYPGLQDITAWVDFSICAAGGVAAGLELASFTPQGGWLVEALARAGLNEMQLSAEAAAQLRTLVLPGEMGERFKLLALTRGIENLEIPGRDLSNRL